MGLYRGGPRIVLIHLVQGARFSTLSNQVYHYFNLHVCMSVLACVHALAKLHYFISFIVSGASSPHCYSQDIPKKQRFLVTTRFLKFYTFFSENLPKSISSGIVFIRIVETYPAIFLIFRLFYKSTLISLIIMQVGINVQVVNSKSQ